MNKSTNILFLSFIIFNLVSNSILISQPEVKWIKIYDLGVGDFSDSEALDVIETADGGFLISGHATYLIAEPPHYNIPRLLRIDANGDSLWAQDAGGYELLQLQNGDYLSVGAKSFDAFYKKHYLPCLGNNNNLLISRTSPEGQLLWSKEYTDSCFNEYNFNIISLADENFLVIGEKRKAFIASGPLPWGYRLFKINTLGDTLWTSFWGKKETIYTWHEELKEIVQTSDGGFIIIGHNYSDQEGINELILHKLNSIGETLWYKTLDLADYISTRSEATTDNAIILLINYLDVEKHKQVLFKVNEQGDSVWTQALGSDLGKIHWHDFHIIRECEYLLFGYGKESTTNTSLYIRKINDQGHKLWEKIHEIPGAAWWPERILKTKDNNLVFTTLTNVYRNHPANRQDDIYILKINKAGNQLWSLHLHQRSEYIKFTPEKIQQTTDSGFILIGGVDVNEGEYYKIKMGAIRLSPDPLTSIHSKSEILSIKTFKLDQNYPNPFNPTTTIKYSLPENSKVVLKIFNLLGEEVDTLIDAFQLAGEKSVVWDGHNHLGQVVNSGIYIYSLKIGNEVNNKRMIFLK